MYLEKILYHRLVPQITNEDDSLDENDDRQLQQYSTWTQHILKLILAAICILIMLVATLISVVLRWEPTDMQCTKKLSLYSPALTAVEYIDYDFPNAFNSTSIYRGPPTPEREAAWVNLTEKHAIEIPADRLAGLNRFELEKFKHVPEEVGTGYIGAIEVFHQLHCLNMVRMYTWWLAGKYPDIPRGLTLDPIKNRMHVDHCIETLRLALQCQADVTPLLVKVGGPIGIRADFSAHHRCRNFEKVEAWIDENWTVY